MFAQLLQSLGSYLDFSKRLATTVPGMVLALALVMLTATAPEWAQQPFACGEVRSLTAEWNDAAHKLETADHNPALRVLRVKESALRRAYFGTANGAEALPARADAANTAFQALQAFYAGEGKALADRRNALKDEEKQADGTLAEVDRELAENRYASLCGKHFDWSGIASDLLMFGLLGFTLGVVFDPVNKAIFLQKLPEMVTPRRDTGKRSRAAFLARAFVPMEHLKKHHPPHLEKRTPQFYIGRGLITAGEYQDRIDQFYRFCEVTTGLVFPIALIGVALEQHYRSQQSFAKAAASLALCWTGSILLSRIGVRRYGEFRVAVSDLIDGRIQQTDDARRQSAEPKVDLAQLQTLVHRADQVMGWWHRGKEGREEP